MKTLNERVYCHKIHTLLLKNSAYPLFIDNPFYMDYPLFLQENLDPSPFYDFSKIPTPYK